MNVDDGCGLLPGAAIEKIVRTLPPVPSVVRYHDDFDDRVYAIEDFDQRDFISVRLDGERRNIHFDRFCVASPIIKHVIAEWFTRLDAHTVLILSDQLRSYVRKIELESLLTLIAASPFDARAHWDLFARAKATAAQAGALRAMLHSLCNLSIGHWGSEFVSIVRALTSSKVDKFRVVRTGDCFLPLDQQAWIVDYIDGACASLQQGTDELPDEALRDACILVISFQYAFRPGQLARIEVADVRVYETGAVHIAVIALKQRDKRKRQRVTRRIKREWAPLFVELLRRRMTLHHSPKGPARLFFQLTSSEISTRIAKITTAITGAAWTPTDLRHTGAQRQVDAGADHLTVSEFMVHASTRTANVYFETSPTQAQSVNQALAISPIYSNVAEIARTRTIDKSMLFRLPADHQIGGVPHGVPIAGIGGCTLGQSLCTKNPVLSCYTCRRFMPIRSPDIHQEVLEGLRPIVHQFAAASRNNTPSPSYAQLRLTLDAVRRVTEALKAEDDVR